MTERKERHFLEALGEGLEAAWDLALDSEAVKAVPVVGTAFKLLSGVEDLRSRALAAKLKRFLDEPRLRSAAEATVLRQKLSQHPEREQEIGEVLFMTLDKVTDLTKPALLARAYASYLEGKVDAYSVEAIAHTLSTSFLRDVLAFLEYPQQPNHNQWRERLTSAGLLRVVDETWDGEVTGYEDTPLGATFAFAIGRIETNRD